jgi:hypothetical protein
MRLVALLTALLVSASSAAFKLSAGVAPAIVGGDVDPALAPWTGRAVAEMLSWEISMVQTIRVVDPATLEKQLPNWGARTELGADELDRARDAGRATDVEAVLVPRVVHNGFEATLQLAVVVRKDMKERVIRLETQGPDDAVLGQLRGQVVNTLDSLGFPVPASMRQMVKTRFTTKWAALLAYGRGLRSLSEGNKEEALRHLRETLTIEPNLSAALVRTRTLEKELPGR